MNVQMHRAVTDLTLSTVEAVPACQELWRVEAAFRSLKDVLELRSVWHRTPERVQAHVLVATLALAIDRVLQRKLAAAGLDWLKHAGGLGRAGDG